MCSSDLLKKLSSAHTIVELSHDDMPFLVDTMRMEMNRLNYTTHLMIHCGGIKVRRDSQNHLTEVYAYHAHDAEHCLSEAPIQMEIDRQTNFEVLESIKQNLIRVLNDVRCTVEDWPLMCTKMQECIDELDSQRHLQSSADVSESKAFLEWLLKNHFTFLGYRDYAVETFGDDKVLRLVPGSCFRVLLF